MSAGAQSYTYNDLGDRVRVDKPTGTRHFVYGASFAFGGRVVAEYGASASDVKAEYFSALLFQAVRQIEFTHTEE
ncbi:MAG: hypothetical protein AAF249_09495 [Pseudomonadota bacterium]